MGGMKIGTALSCRFHNVFGVSIETVESQPILGWTDDTDIDEAEVFFFDGWVVNIPFIKIMWGDVYNIFE
jgi:hypothetical protein